MLGVDLIQTRFVTNDVAALARHYSALIGQRWDEYIAAMRAGVEKHGPVRAGLYSMLKDRR